MNNDKRPTLTHGSLFSGIGGFDHAWDLCAEEFPGWKFVTKWVCEIEPSPVAILRRHFSKAKQLGNIMEVKGSEIEPVDVLTFGSPCQGMSVAGTRCGLESDQSESVLFYQGIRIIHEMRESTNGEYPKYILWENVPGAYSSNKGLDFRAVLEEITKADIPMPESGRWATAGMVRGGAVDIAWRTPDAQHWGVPQRRKRIKLVGDFTGGCAAELLFEQSGVPRHFAKSLQQRQRATADLGICVDTAGVPGRDYAGRDERTPEQFMFENHSQDCRYKGPLRAGETVAAKYGTGGNNQPLIAMNILQDPVPTENISPCLTSGNSKAGQACIAIAYSLDSKESNSMNSGNPNSGCREVAVARTLDTTRPDPSKNQGGIAIVEGHAYSIQGNMIGRADKNGPQGAGVNEGISFTLNATDQHGVCYAIDRAAFNQGENAQYGIGIKENGIAQTVVAKGPGCVCAPPEFIVRRLTPLEGERLQGFPDGWTEYGAFEYAKNIRSKHKKDFEKGMIRTGMNEEQLLMKIADSARYKALGNAVDIPTTLHVMALIAKSLIRLYEGRQKSEQSKILESEACL